MWCIKIMLLLLATNSAFERRKVIYLGGIFDDNGEDEPIFRLAVDQHANYQLRDYGIKFSPLTQNISSNDPYSAMVTTCSFLSQGVVAIFGPKNEENINSVRSICDHKDIVHVITRWDYQPNRSTVINFYPLADSLSLVYFQLIMKWEWKSFTVFYENNENLLRILDLVKRAKDAGVQVAVKKLDETGEQVYRGSLKQGLNSGEKNFVIDCSLEILETVLIHAQQVGLMTNNYNFFITNLDMHTVNLEPFKYNKAKISGIKLAKPSDKIVQETIFNINTLKTWTTERALLVDAVAVITRAIAKTGSFQNIDPKELGCDSQKSLKHGTSLINDVKTSTFYNGLTGVIEFDARRFRSNFDLDILKLNEKSGLIKTGTWNLSQGLQIESDTSIDTYNDTESLRNKHFIIITCLTDPYGMLKESSNTLTGNDRFEGFGIDLIHKLSQMESFSYTFIIREDKANGKKLSNGSWSGMIGDVMEGRADFAIADLTITAEREEAVDFTSPFMNLGISILAKKPKEAPPNFFTFADPFDLDTWIMIVLAYALVAVSFFVLGRLCPGEWTNPYPCVEEPEYLINQFSFKNSAWFAIGSLMQQGSEVAPIAISTRMVAGIWWFFVLLVVSSYTANLAASLTTENPIDLFTDVQSLVENREKYNIRMGAKSGGATSSFFKDKTEETYKAIAEYMDTHPADMVPENEDGVRLAETETYAFFMESTSIEYQIQRHCSLKKYGELLDDKGYGIAMKKNSPYRKRLSTAILKLQVSGQLDGLKRKWWMEMKGGGLCFTANDNQFTPLSIKHLEGVFYVTIGGTILSVFLVVGEMITATFKMSLKTRMAFREALKIEMNGYFKFSSNMKSVIQENLESKSGSGSGSPKGRGALNTNLKPPPHGSVPSISISKEDLAEELD